MSTITDCPFCGSANIAAGYEQLPPGAMYYMRCISCGARGPSVPQKSDSGTMQIDQLTAWNRRTPAATSGLHDAILALHCTIPFEFCPSPLRKAYMHAFDAARLAAAELAAAHESQSAPAQQESAPNDSSMPIDMAQAKRWVVQLRARIESLLAVINEKPAAPAMLTDEPIVAIYQATFNSMPGAARKAPEPQGNTRLTICAFARAILAAGISQQAAPDDAWNAAIEAAAKMCERQQERYRGVAVKVCAYTIRTLKKG